MNIKIKFLTLICIIFGLYSSVNIAEDRLSSIANIVSQSGETLGTVAFVEYPNGVVITANLSGLSPGTHGFHIHEKGSCGNNFKRAGGHFNPVGESHGIGYGSGMHAGDLPNLLVSNDGKANFEIYNSFITLSESDISIFDADGSSIIIHENADSYMKDAGAGGRVGCGVINSN